MNTPRTVSPRSPGAGADAVPGGVPLPMLLDGLADAQRARDVRVTGVESYSRNVSAGDLYLALQGSHAHGLDFVPEAVRRGANAVVWEGARGGGGEHGAPAAPAVAMVRVDGLRDKVGVIAGRFFGHPSRELSVVAVTGTDGKTSVSHFIAEALSLSGRRCGLIGTLGHGEFGRLVPGVNTTPDALALNREMRRLRDAGVGHVVLEASSHGLDQGRLNGLDVDIAVFTNLGADHCDYHGSLEQYAAAKKRLFLMPGLDCAVINRDDDYAAQLMAACRPGTRVVTCSALSDAADVFITKTTQTADGLGIEARVGGDEVLISAPLFGRFNAANLAAALAALTAAGLGAREAASLLSRVHPVRGRMQRFGGGAAPVVVLDYAHTPQALEKALATCRELGAARLACVFGCGGERDRAKRPLMGAAAARLPDRLVVTDDNPRTEDPDAIVSDILSAVADRRNVEVVRDRARAIEAAVADAGAGDIVLVAGKGHETRQLVAGQSLPFDDDEVRRRALGARA